MSKWNDSIETARAEADRLGLPCRRIVAADVRFNVNPQPPVDPSMRVEIHPSSNGRDSEFRFVPDGLPFK